MRTPSQSHATPLIVKKLTQHVRVGYSYYGPSFTRRTTATAVDNYVTYFSLLFKVCPSVRGDMVGICKQTADYCIKAHLCEKNFAKFKIKKF